jgi:hypothetical protein
MYYHIFYEAELPIPIPSQLSQPILYILKGPSIHKMPRASQRGSNPKKSKGPPGLSQEGYEINHSNKKQGTINKKGRYLVQLAVLVTFYPTIPSFPYHSLQAQAIPFIGYAPYHSIGLPLTLAMLKNPLRIVGTRLIIISARKDKRAFLSLSTGIRTRCLLFYGALSPTLCLLFYGALSPYARLIHLW